MLQAEQTDPVLEGVPIKERLRGTNINPETFLATDYLNHFTEVVMLLEMVPSMPECMEDVRQWHPKSYQAHFAGSVFSDRDLAILAYEAADPAVRGPFDALIGELHDLLTGGIVALERLVADGETEALEVRTADLLAQVRDRLDRASALIHGRQVTLDQASIDAALGT